LVNAASPSQPAPQPEDERPILGTAYWCLRGQRRHRAYLQPGRGGSVWWCRTHGVLMSVTHGFYRPDATAAEVAGRKKMTVRQQRRFILRRDGGK